MANSFDTSFIPQQPLLKVEDSSRRRESVDVILAASFVIFFVVLVVWGGMYFYKAGVDRRVLAIEKELESKEASLKPDEIDRYKVIDERLNVAGKLLRGHVAFSAILTLLEKITAQNIGWTTFSYVTDDTNGSESLNLTGQAQSYSAVYAQVEAWRNMRKILKEVRVGTPLLNSASGVVTFEATLVIDPSYIKYARTIKKSDADVPESSDSTTTTTPQSIDEGASVGETNISQETP